MQRVSTRLDVVPLPLYPPQPLLLLFAVSDRPDLFRHPVRAIAPAQGIVVRRDLFQPGIFLHQPVIGGVQRGILPLEPVIAIVQPIEAVYKVKIEEMKPAFSACLTF